MGHLVVKQHNSALTTSVTVNLCENKISLYILKFQANSLGFQSVETIIFKIKFSTGTYHLIKIKTF